MNKWLKGNGYWCHDCNGTGRGKALDRIEYAMGGICQFYAKCPICNGEKRIAANADEILNGTVPQTPDPEYHTCMFQTIEYGRCT